MYEWYIENISKSNRIFIIIYDDSLSDKAVGYLYLDLNKDIPNEIEISYAVDSKIKGKGIGTEIVDYAVKFVKNELIEINQINAWISTENIGSIKVVKKNLFQPVNQYKKVLFGNGVDMLFQLYKLSLVYISE